MNTYRYLGLDNVYSSILMHDNYRCYSRFAEPYVVDEQLRETPIIPEYSFRAFSNDAEWVICNYLNPLANGKQLFIQLSRREYEEYMYIRNNAFYTPYGVMVLLNQPMIACTNSFQLENDSLIPENRPIKPVDTKMVPSRGGYIGATFFADYVMENIILKPTGELLHDSNWGYNTRAPCPVLMKRFKLYQNIPVYDVQFQDLMTFDTMISYDMYMLALSNYINGRPSNADQLNFRFNPSERVFKCYPINYTPIQETVLPEAKPPKIIKNKEPDQPSIMEYFEDERRRKQEEARQDAALWATMRTHYQ